MLLALIAALAEGGALLCCVIPLAETGHPAFPFASSLVPVVGCVITGATAACGLLRYGSARRPAGAIEILIVALPIAVALVGAALEAAAKGLRLRVVKAVVGRIPAAI